MEHVYLLTTATTPVAEHWERTAVSLAREALLGALSGVPVERVGALYVANALGTALHMQSQLGAAIAAASGLSGVEAHTVEAGGASGGVALRQAYLAIASGAHDLVAVVGVEKPTDVLDGRLEAALALSTDVDYEAVHGVTLTAQWAMLMRRYMHEYGYTAADFAPFPVNAHANGVANKQALYRFPINADKVSGGAMVADPIGLLDSSTQADGAAALLLASERFVREWNTKPIRIAGSAVATDTLALFKRNDPLWIAAAARSSATALQAAKLTASDVNVIDVTDPHGIAAALALEANGFVERGSAVAAAREGAITPSGSLPLATGGGCKARGDIIGANGVYQVAELARQLRGEAGATQVPNARVAFAQCLGGIGVTAATHVLIAE